MAMVKGKGKGSDIEFYNCGKKGHMAKDCWSAKGGKGNPKGGKGYPSYQNYSGYKGDGKGKGYKGKGYGEGDTGKGKAGHTLRG